MEIDVKYDCENAKKLHEIAETDEIYCLIKEQFEMYRKKLEKIERFLPNKLITIIYGYASYGMMMEERKQRIACECMKFTENKVK